METAFIGQNSIKTSGKGPSFSRANLMTAIADCAMFTASNDLNVG
jgi:hypothetical protein